MPNSKKTVLDYGSEHRNSIKRWIVISLAICVVAAAGLTVKNWHYLRWYHLGPNGPINYTGAVGGHDALIIIQRAVSAYAEANNGTLPTKLMDVKPFIKMPVPWPYRVMPADMLPHVTLVRPGDGVARLYDNEPWNFIVMVHVLGNGPMTFNWTLVAANTPHGFEDAYRDPDFIAAFGAQQLKQLKQSAYQLP